VRDWLNNKEIKMKDTFFYY